MAASEPSGCLVSIFRIFGIGGRRGIDSGDASPPMRTGTPLPYLRKDWLFTQAERSFFGVLEQAVGGIDGQLRIFAKVRLCDVLRIAAGSAKKEAVGGDSYRAHFNRIQSKHVDFVICSRDAVRPLILIELDDSSHQREDRQARDGFVDAACKAASLPLLHVLCKAGYSVNELAGQIRAALSSPK